MRGRSALVLALASILATFSGHTAGLVAGLALAVLAAVAAGRGALAAALRPGLLITVLFAAALTGLAVAWASGPERAVDAAAGLTARFLVLAMLSVALARAVDTERLLAGARVLGLERLPLILGLALNVMPRLAEASSQVLAAWRVRRRLAHSGPARLAALPEVLLAHAGRLADEAAAAAALRGHHALAGTPRVVVAAATRVVVVTGPPGSGKTTVAARTAAALAAAGIPLAGFLQPGRFAGEAKTGFSVRDVATGEEAQLAQRVERAAGEHGTQFHFFPAGFELARAALARPVAGGVLVVDELGPVELRGGGHLPAVRRALAGGGARAALVVVRRQLVPALIAALEAVDVVVIDVAEAGERAEAEVMAAADAAAHGQPGFTS